MAVTKTASHTLSSGWVIFSVILTLLWFLPLDYRFLVKPDEGRYAEIAREMFVSGDWITPHLNGIKYFEKPAFQYWMTALFYSLFGVNEWTARLWSALSAFGTIWVMYFATARLFTVEIAKISCYILVGSPLFIAIGHINTLDMGVSFFMTIGLFAFLLSQSEKTPEPEKKYWLWLVWIVMGCAVLSKGLIGLVLPGFVLVVYMLLKRDFQLLLRLELIRGLGLFFLVTVPWFVLVSLKNPEFPHFFFIHEHFERFFTKVHRREGAWWYFFPILALGFLPWLMTLLDVFRLKISSLKETLTTRQFDPVLFLILWSVLIFFFFSISGSKLPSYILPIFPSLAVLTALKIEQYTWKKFAGIITLPLMISVIGLLVVNQYLPAQGRSPFEQNLYQDYSPWLVAACISFGLGGLQSLLCFYRQNKERAFIGLSLFVLIGVSCILQGHNSLAPLKSTYFLVEKIKPYYDLKQDETTPFFAVRTYEQTLPYYLGRTLTLVEFADEMAFGIKQEPQKWVPTLHAFKTIWLNQTRAFALLKPEEYAAFRKDNLPMNLIYQDDDRIIVTRHALTLLSQNVE